MNQLQKMNLSWTLEYRSDNYVLMYIVCFCNIWLLRTATSPRDIRKEYLVLPSMGNCSLVGHMRLTGSDLIYPEIQFLEASLKSCDRLYTCYSEAAVKAMPEQAPHQSSCWNTVGFIC